MTKSLPKFLTNFVTRKVSRLAMLCRDAATDIRLGIWTLGPIQHVMPDPESRNVHYEPLKYSVIRALSRRLNLGAGDVVCDIGCGKGRIVCWFARQRVSRVIGIDCDPRLTSAAEENLQTLRQCRAMGEIRTEDATESDFDGVNVFIMFNPFGAEVMNSVLNSIKRSVAHSPRRITLVYICPVHIDVFDNSGFLTFVEEFQFLYENSRESVLIYENKY